VIASLFDRFRGDRCEALVARAREPLVQRQLKGVDQHLAHDGLAEIAVRLLDERRIQVLAVLAQERDVILAAAAPLELAGIGQQQPRLTNEVEGDVGEPEILLERRRMTHPLAQPLAEHEREIAEPQHVSITREHLGRSGPVNRTHSVLTSGGMS
jgi:hypothetical protein